MKLTPKQRAFCDYYIETGNATEAAIKAGYSEKTARKIGHENLTKLDIKKYIDEKLEEMSSNRIADASETMEYLTKVIRDEETEETVVVINVGDFMSEPKIVDKKIGAKDKLKAAELLGKRYRLWTDKVEVEGAIPIVIAGDDELED
ncbi:terminase small subunit [Metaclostridioides mangenotii]|uniref:terminase small subunit n=1 Tax=Metaclostridioides mangenotii TaxID=1540 RepID=UPI0028EF9652|nr:terminase small subunit [Clostridioides mangenotii]